MCTYPATISQNTFTLMDHKIPRSGDSTEVLAKRLQITSPKRDHYIRATIKSSSPQTQSFSTQKPPCLRVFRYLLFLETLAYFNCTLTAEKYFYYGFERHVTILSLSESKEKRNTNSAVDLRNVSENLANIRDSSYPPCAVSGE